ncbi:MAG: AtpZ/AtpI family protein [Planctomycetota bacterium]
MAPRAPSRPSSPGENPGDADPRRDATGSKPATPRYAVYSRYATLGFQFGVTLVAFCYAGNWLGGHFDFEPWGTLAGAGLGFLGGFLWLYREIFSPRAKPPRGAL